ncbi:MAG: 3-deoxy-manno-octulosonate cytidylyltransferase, partial [Rikenellaceae bacterium]
NRAKEFGCEVIMTSDKHPSGTDRCCEALEKAEELFKMKFDVVVNIQGDEPFIHTSQLEQVKAAFADPTVDIATLVKPFGDGEDIFNPNSPKVVLSKNGKALYFSRSVIPYLRGKELSQWQKEYPFYKHIGLYAYRSSVLREITRLPQGVLERCESLEQLRWLENGYQIKCEVTHEESYAIDTPADLEQVLERYRNEH